MVGIDPTTGTQKFSVLLDDQQPYYQLGPPGGWTCSTGTFFSGDSAASSIIVAGDGYAYVGYGYSEYNINCTTGDSFISHVMLLRIGSDGSYSKIKFQDVIAPLPDGIPPQADVVSLSMISNADTGVLVAWSAGWIGENYSVRPQFGMAITAGTSVTNLNAPQVPGQCMNALAPVLQAQDGSFVGTVQAGPSCENQMVAFDASGNVRWTVPNEQPLYATPDGGVIGESGIFYDRSGNARNQLTPAVQSWLTESYVSAGGAIADVQLPQIPWASSYQAITGGNPSFNGTAVGVAQSVEGVPIFGLKSRGPTCQLGANKVALAGAPLDWVNNEKQQLINGGSMTSTACREFFNQPDADPARAPFFSLLTTAVTQNLPVFWDGLQTNISFYDAGFLSANNTNPTDIGIYKTAPVCGQCSGPHFLDRKTTLS